MRTSAASFTATSSPRTSSSSTARSCGSPISASPGSRSAPGARPAPAPPRTLPPRTAAARAVCSGPLGSLAPEQAMGRPSYHSDVFSLGLIIYRMLTGSLPEWPFDWPAPGYERLRKRVPAEMIAFLRRALDVDPAQSYRDAGQLLAALQRGHA